MNEVLKLNFFFPSFYIENGASGRKLQLFQIMMSLHQVFLFSIPVCLWT